MLTGTGQGFDSRIRLAANGFRRCVLVWKECGLRAIQSWQVKSCCRRRNMVRPLIHGATRFASRHRGIAHTWVGSPGRPRGKSRTTGSEHHETSSFKGRNAGGSGDRPGRLGGYGCQSRRRLYFRAVDDEWSGKPQWFWVPPRIRTCGTEFSRDCSERFPHGFGWTDG